MTKTEAVVVKAAMAWYVAYKPYNSGAYGTYAAYESAKDALAKACAAHARSLDKEKARKGK